MLNKNHDNFPYYKDVTTCQNCGHILSNQIKIVNLELEQNYQRKVVGKCKKCDYGYNLIKKIFIGADGEKYFGSFDSTGNIVTCSGVLTNFGNWDKNKLIRENKAKNFKLNIDLKRIRSNNESN